MTEIEAFARAWASIDGKLEEFLAEKDGPADLSGGGYFEGYMTDAEELIKRARRLQQPNN